MEGNGRGNSVGCNPVIDMRIILNHSPEMVALEYAMSLFPSIVAAFTKHSIWKKIWGGSIGNSFVVKNQASFRAFVQ